MVVDDDDDDLAFVKEGCINVGIQNLVFHNQVKEAVTSLVSMEDDQLPAVIVTDVNMPGYTGIDFIKFLKSDTRLKAIRTVIFSDRYLKEERHIFKLLNVDLLVAKPYNDKGYKDLCLKLKELAEG